MTDPLDLADKVLRLQAELAQLRFEVKWLREALRASLEELGKLRQRNAATDSQCEVCGKMRPLTKCWTRGIEAWACNECRGLSDNAGEGEV